MSPVSRLTLFHHKPNNLAFSVICRTVSVFSFTILLPMLDTKFGNIDNLTFKLAPVVANLLYTPVYKTLHFLSRSQGASYTCYWYFSNIKIPSNQEDPKRRYSRHPVYCYVMAKLVPREVTVISVYVKLAHCKK